MGFLEELWKDIITPRGTISIYEYDKGYFGNPTKESFIEEYKNKYIYIDVGFDFDLKKAVWFDMIKVINGKIISNKKILIKNDNSNVGIPEGFLLRDEISEREAYQSFMDFFDNNLKSYGLLIENSYIVSYGLKDCLERYGYNGTINFITTGNVICNNKELATSNIDEIYIRLGILYNLFIDEIDFKKHNLTKMELRNNIFKIGLGLDKSKYNNNNNRECEEYIYAYIKKMLLKSNVLEEYEVENLALRYPYWDNTYATITYKNDDDSYYEVMDFKVENGEKIFSPLKSYCENIKLPKTEFNGDFKIWFDKIKDIDKLKQCILKNIELALKYNLPTDCDCFNIDITKLDDFLNKHKNVENIINNKYENIIYSINPIHNRIEKEKIKMKYEPAWYINYLIGHELWLEGEKLRKQNKFKEAIKKYDNARERKYEQLNLYVSYAKAYHELKDYDNEVCILDEGIKVVEGNIDSLEEKRFEAFKLAWEASKEREKIELEKAKEELENKKKKEQEEKKKYLEQLKKETEERKKREKEEKEKIKQKKLEDALIYQKKKNKIVSKIIRNSNLCLLYRDIIKSNIKINKKLEKMNLSECCNFEELLWLYLFEKYDGKEMPRTIGAYYNENCYNDTNILKEKYINEYILNYFSKNKQDKDYYEVFEKKEKELDKINKKEGYKSLKTSIGYYIEFFVEVIIRCIELIDVVDIFDNDKELNKMYRNLITVTDDVKYITEKIYPIYKKCYASKLEVKVSKVDLEIVLYLKRKLADEIEIEITQKNKRQAVIKVMMDNYGKVLKKEEDKFIYVLIKLISYQNSKEIDEYINILKKVDEIIEKVNEKIVLEEAEQEKERILSGDLRKEVTLNRLKMTYASVTSPAEFEQYVADLYERLGYTIDEVVDKNKRGGADIIAFKDDIKYVIQVKYYTKPVNKNGIIEVVAAKKLYKANKGIHVTNSYYSMSAMQFAAQNNIELVDGEMIEEYISEISQKNNK